MRSVAALLALAMIASACTGQEDPPEEPQARFGTADAQLLVLGEGSVPDDFELIVEVSGPQTVHQFATGDGLAASLSKFGAKGGFGQYFSVQNDGFLSQEPAQPLRANELLSRSMIFPNGASATRALAFLYANPGRELTGVEVKGERSLGEGAYRQRSMSGVANTVGYYWQVDNAVVTLAAVRAHGRANEGELLALAHGMADAIAEADPTGESLELPPVAEPGSTILEETFEGRAHRQGSFHAAPEAARLSRYVDGGFQIGIDSSGARFHDTAEFGEPSLIDIGDSIVEVDAEHIQGSSVRWGLQCRLENDGDFYLFLIGSDGYAGIFRARTSSQTFLPYAETGRSRVVKDAVVIGRHHLRVDCTGDPIARLGLYVNERLILEAFEDDPLPSGAAGMWVESEIGPAAVLFDGFKVSET